MQASNLSRAADTISTCAVDLHVAIGPAISASYFFLGAEEKGGGQRGSLLIFLSDT